MGVESLGVERGKSGVGRVGDKESVIQSRSCGHYRRIKETTNIIITLRRGNNEFYRINELLDE